jgi:hypothetical protein
MPLIASLFHGVHKTSLETFVGSPTTSIIVHQPCCDFDPNCGSDGYSGGYCYGGRADI